MSSAWYFDIAGINDLTTIIGSSNKNVEMPSE